MNFVILCAIFCVTLWLIFIFATNVPNGITKEHKGIQSFNYIYKFTVLNIIT